MSEKLYNNGEQNLGNIDLSAESKKNLEQLKQKASEEKHRSKQAIEELAVAAESVAVSGKEVSIGERQENNNQTTPIGLQKEIKDKAYSQTMTKVRRRLPKGERILSKVLHQPIVQTVSEVTAKTVARPSGFLVGGLFALVGSGFLFFAARYYGFTYNYTLFFILFIGGYICGVLGELLFKAVSHKY